LPHAHSPAALRSSSQNSAAAYAVRSTLSDAELAQAKTAFFETDQDGSGAIDRSELAHMLKSLGQTPTKSMIEDIFIAADGGADANGNGKIELREFLCWYTEQLQKKNSTAHDDVRCTCTTSTSTHAYAHAHAHAHAHAWMHVVVRGSRGGTELICTNI
jgi:hypothetical protein